jgi:hypothetical protein
MAGLTEIAAADFGKPTILILGPGVTPEEGAEYGTGTYYR